MVAHTERTGKNTTAPPAHNVGVAVEGTGPCGPARRPTSPGRVPPSIYAAHLLQLNSTPVGVFCDGLCIFIFSSASLRQEPTQPPAWHRSPRKSRLRSLPMDPKQHRSQEMASTPSNSPRVQDLPESHRTEVVVPDSSNTNNKESTGKSSSSDCTCNEYIYNTDLVSDRTNKCNATSIRDDPRIPPPQDPKNGPAGVDVEVDPNPEPFTFVCFFLSSEDGLAANMVKEAEAFLCRQFPAACISCDKSLKKKIQSATKRQRVD